MDGLELCNHVKTNVDYSHIPIILLTAKNTLQAKIEGLEQGADAYIEKPFSIEYLMVQVANLLRNRKNIRDYFANSPLTQIKSMANSKEDDRFLETLNDAINDNLHKPDFDIEQLADCMNIGRRTLFRKIKGISNLSPNELINLARLKKPLNYSRKKIIGYMKLPIWLVLTQPLYSLGYFISNLDYLHLNILILWLQ